MERIDVKKNDNIELCQNVTQYLLNKKFDAESAHRVVSPDAQ